MMRTLKIVLVALLAFSAQRGQAQVYRFLTTGFSVMERKADGKWGDWSELQPAAIVVSLDTSKNRIVVYSQEVQLYDIVDYREAEENDNDLIYTFDCSDENGMPFTISIITRKKQGNRKQLYINQKDVVLMYNIVNHVGKDEK